MCVCGGGGGGGMGDVDSSGERLFSDMYNSVRFVFQYYKQ